MGSDLNSNSSMFLCMHWYNVTYQEEENQMKNEGARVITTLYSYIVDA